MADIKINEKLVVSQTGTAEPVLASNVTIPAAGITGTLGSGIFPTGHIIQIKSSTKTDTATTTSEADNGVTTGLTVTLDNNLASSSNKVIIMVSVGGISDGNGSSGSRFWINGVNTSAEGDAGGSCQQVAFMSKIRADVGGQWDTVKTGSMTFEDAPATVTPQTYTLYMNSCNGGTIYLNRPFVQNGNGGNTISTITAMEIQV